MRTRRPQVVIQKELSLALGAAFGAAPGLAAGFASGLAAGLAACFALGATFLDELFVDGHEVLFGAGMDLFYHELAECAGRATGRVRDRRRGAR